MHVHNDTTLLELESLATLPQVTSHRSTNIAHGYKVKGSVVEKASGGKQEEDGFAESVLIITDAVGVISTADVI